MQSPAALRCRTMGMKQKHYFLLGGSYKWLTYGQYTVHIWLMMMVDDDGYYVVNIWLMNVNDG